MQTVIYNGNVILPDFTIENGYVVFENGKITDVGSVFSFGTFEGEAINAEGKYISPGFIDLHVHGGAGFRFVDATKEAVTAIANVHAKHGTTTMFPTLSSFDYETMVHVIDNIHSHKDDADVPRNIWGIHIEGPYCSKKQSGAQKADVYRDPVEREYKGIIEKYGSFIKRWSYAPENAGTVNFQKYLNEHNVLGAVAHSDATYEDIMKVYPYGLRLVTHLYSNTSTITRKEGFRHLGIIETAYLHDDFYVETIADGCHLPPDLLKMIYKIKGDKRMCLVSDATRFGGAENDFDTDKRGAEKDFIIEDGVAKLPDRSAFVGSLATGDRLVRTCCKKAGISIGSAVRMISATPAELFGITNKGKLLPGCDADILLFDDNIVIDKVIIGGKIYK